MDDVRRFQAGGPEVFGPGVLVYPIALDGAAFPFAIARFEVAPGARSDTGSHGANEMWHVLQGEGRLITDDGALDVRAGDTLHLKPDTTHAIANAGDTPFIALSLTWPATGDA